MDRIQLTSDSLNRSNKLSAGLKGPNHFGQKPSNYPSLLYFKENYIKNILGKYVKNFSVFIYLFIFYNLLSESIKIIIKSLPLKFF
jgi:hypothetical protein